jgi:Protein of unknown function (DUF4038)
MVSSSADPCSSTAAARGGFSSHPPRLAALGTGTRTPTNRTTPSHGPRQPCQPARRTGPHASSLHPRIPPRRRQPPDLVLRRWRAAVPGRRHRLGAAVAGHPGRRRCLRRRPPGERLQRGADDECSARHEHPRTWGRNVDEGFEVGFRDLPDGHLTEINIDYFQYFDPHRRRADRPRIHPDPAARLPGLRLEGQTGRRLCGPARQVRPLLPLPRGQVRRSAGDLPAGADGVGSEAPDRGRRSGDPRLGRLSQPTGIHYQPHTKANKHLDADWLDFQSCQTGHMGDHVPDRVATIWAQQPPKAVINVEPSYKHGGRRGSAKAGGWATRRGATSAPARPWASVMAPQASGRGGCIPTSPVMLRTSCRRRRLARGPRLRRQPLRRPRRQDPRRTSLGDAEPCWDVSTNARGLLDPNVLYVGYAEHGGPWDFLDGEGRVPSRFWMIDPRIGAVLKSGNTPANGVPIENDRHEPSLLICLRQPRRSHNPRRRQQPQPDWDTQHCIDIRVFGEFGGR